MNLKPYEEFSIISKLSTDEAQKNLARWTMLYNPVMDRIEYVEGRYYLFKGSVHQGRFKLKSAKADFERYRRGREGIVLMIKGSIDGSETGSSVHVKILPTYSVILPVLLIVVFEILLVGAAAGEGRWPFILLAIFTPFISYLGIKFSIGSDAAVMERDLRKIFE
jgi:hypothetical protein